MIIKTLGRMFYGQMSQKYNFVDDMGPIMPGINQTLHLTVKILVIVWECFSVSGPGRLSLLEGTMNSALY
jgi:hypothetical protein